tara:strand:+ start:78 stop:881 length:804 start_codon:yes stop_codon:yes gene_type:complete
MPVYKDTANNRKLDRVGMGYGKECSPCKVKRADSTKIGSGFSFKKPGAVLTGAAARAKSTPSAPKSAPKSTPKSTPKSVPKGSHRMPNGSIMKDSDMKKKTKTPAPARVGQMKGQQLAMTAMGIMSDLGKENKEKRLKDEGEDRRVSVVYGIEGGGISYATLVFSPVRKGIIKGEGGVPGGIFGDKVVYYRAIRGLPKDAVFRYYRNGTNTYYSEYPVAMYSSDPLIQFKKSYAGIKYVTGKPKIPELSSLKEMLYHKNILKQIKKE